MKLNINKIGIKSGRPKFFIIPIPKILSPIPKTSSRSRSPTRMPTHDLNVIVCYFMSNIKIGQKRL